MTVRAIRNVTPPNYPVAPDQYTRAYQDQFTNVVRLYSNTVANAINAPKVHGSYFDTTTQTNGGATTVNLMKLNSTASSYGTKIGSPTSRVYVNETGVYNIQFSAQFDKTSGASADIYIWLRINGQNVPNSASKIVVQGTSAELIAAWNFVTSLEANDYVEIAWASTDTNVVLLATAPTAGPPAIPEIPSVILTITWVSNISI
jgi:hypothetical protein